MKERLKQIMEELDMTATEFADKIGVQASSISHIINGRNNPSSAFIEKLLDALPELNARWFMLGAGNMFEGEKPKTQSVPFAGTLFGDEQFIPKSPEKKMKPENKPAENPVSKKPELTADKEIKKIIVLYNDKTFEQYNLPD